MARVIGLVKSLEGGIFFAKDAQGVIRELGVGDQILQNELVYGGPKNAANAQIIIDVTLTDAKDISILGSSELYVDLSVIGGSFEKEEAIVAEDTVQNAWQLTTNMPSQDASMDGLAETAAGLEATAAGEGLTDSERAGGPIFDARTGGLGNVSTDLRNTLNGEINPNLVGPDTQNLNDQPVVAYVEGTVNEALNGLNIISGQLVATDPDIGDTHTFFAVEDSLLINGEPAPDGIVLVLNLDGTYSVSGDFNALAINEDAVITFQYYAVDDGIDVGAPHESLPATVSITINGTNDQPVINDVHITGDGDGGSIVGYYDMSSGQGVSAQVASITTADLTAVQLFTLSANELESINTLYIQNPSNGSYGAEYLTQLSVISDAVNNGMTLIIHDRFVTNGAQILPGGESIVFHRDFVNDADIEILDNGLETGLGGTINDTSLDGGNSSSHGYVDLESLPEGAVVLMTNGIPNQVVTFSYAYGLGTIIYSTIPLDFYLNNSGTINTNMQIYAANLLEDYALDKVIYETYDDTDISPLTKDDNNVLTGTLTVIDDDVSDTHTFRIVDESVQVFDVSQAGIDLGDVTVNISLVEGTWQYRINGNFTELASGESATVTFQYVADDGHGFDGTDGINESSISMPKTVTLVVTGTNDQPMVSDVILETQQEALNGMNTFTGTLVANDDDTNDTHEFFGVLDEDQESIAYTVEADTEIVIQNITVNTDGTYTVMGDFNALAEGESATITFQYYAIDSSATQVNGESNTSEIKTVTMTILGTNDQPVIENVNANGSGVSGEITYTTEEGQSIYDYHTTLSPIVVTDSGIIQDLNIKINVAHSWDSDLNIGLIAPNGAYISLAYHLGGSGDGYANTLFDDEASMSITSAGAPFTGTFSPQGGVLSTFDGLDMQGTWTLSITDEVGWDSGYLYSWSLIIDSDGGQKVYESMSESTPATEDVLTTFSGVLSDVSDDDTSDSHTYRMEGMASVDNTLVTDLGVVVNSDGNYFISGNFNALASGESATVTFQYVADDGHGFDGTDGINESSISEPKMVTLVITGTNDQPIISEVNINAPLSFGGDNWFAEGNGLTIVGYENNGSIITPILHNGGLGIGSGWGENPEINDQMSFGGRSTEAIVFGFEKAFNTATIELTSLNQGTWFNSAEKAEWIAYKDGVEVGRGILSAQAGLDIFTITTASDFNSLKIAPPLDWESDSFYIKSLNVSKTFYESYDATPIDTTEDATTTFSGNLDATVMDDDTNDTHQFFGVMGEDEESIAYELDAPSAGVSVDTITINPDGAYLVTGNFNALAAGESATITFQYYAVDSSSTQVNGESNTSESKTVTMTITGTNDQPIVTDFTVNVNEASLLEVAGKEDYRYVGQLDVSDHDVSDTHTFSMLSNSVKVSITTENGDGGSSTTTLTSHQIQHLMWEGKLSISLNENTGEYTVSSTLFNALGSNQSMSVSFDYRASDGNGFDGTDGRNESSFSVAETATLVVNGTNDQPVAYGDTQSTWEQELSNIPSEDATFGGRLPGASDEDAISHITYAGVDADDNGKVDVSVVAPIGVDASQTMVIVNANGTYSISNPTFDTLGAGEKATVTFSYVVDDGSGATDESSQSAPKSVTLTIFGTNDQPVVENVTIPGTEAITGLNTFTGSLHVNDIDTTDDHTFTIRAGSITSNNPLVSDLSVSLTSEGTYTIIGDFNKLALGESATIRFQYRADDGSGSPSWDESRYSDYKTVTLNVTGTNDTPVFTVEEEAYSFNYNENSAAGTLIGTVLATDIDHGSSVSYSISSGNDDGYFTINPTTGAITLTEAGAHAFTNDFETLANSHALIVGASDGIVTTSINVTLNEQNVNDAPGAIDDFGVSGVRAQFYGYNEGVDGTNLLSIAQIRAFMADNTPDATFTPTLLDYQYGTGNLASATHLQTFLGADAASLSTDPNDATDGIIHMSGYLNMDAGTYNFKVLSDDGYAILIDGQPVATFDNIQSPATHEHASFSIAASGLHQVEVIYWDQAGEYVFKAEISKNGGAYQVLDMSGGTSSLVTPEDTALTLTAATLLANDIDQDGDTLSITSVQGATHGTVVLNGDGTVTFAPEANYNGVATFTYTVNDGHGGSDTATVTLNVTPVNDAPSFAQPYAFNYNENSAVGAVIGTVQATDIDSASLTYSIIGGNSNGYFAINSTTGAISLTALGATSLANNYEAPANTHNLTVSASDGILSASIAVTLNEQNVNEAPPVSTVDDRVITNAGTAAFVIPEWALLANDTGATDVTAISNINSLTATLNNGSISVQDGSSLNGGSFDYTADGVSVAHVSVTQDGGWDLDGTNNSEILIADNSGDDIYGYGGNDILIGGNAKDYIDGEDGNDMLVGGNGSDELYGGNGNDILVYDNNDDALNGETGTDTLVFTSDTSINFNNFDSSPGHPSDSKNPIDNMEIFDFTKANVALTNLSLQDVIDMTDNSKDLYILGGVGDSVDLLNSNGWSKGASTVTESINGASRTFEVYTNSGDPSVIVKIEQNISDTI